ncbi:MAG: hypothetical protein AAGD07_25305 [Planctomycetota bacterium]
MNQKEINRAVALATGETVSAIKRLGFLIADPDQVFEDPSDPVHGGRVIDWDDFELASEAPDEQCFDPEAIFC